MRGFLLNILSLLAIGVIADPVIPNAQFSNGHDCCPASWRLTQKDGGDWLRNAGRDGGAAIRVTGKGTTSTQWRSDSVKLEAGRCYLFSFWSRGSRKAPG